MKNKKQICVELTQKNIKKVYGTLKMFPKDKINGADEVMLETGMFPSGMNFNDWLKANTGKAYLYFNGNVWTISIVDEDKTIIKPRELRNILFAEHCKEGDYVVVGGREQEFVARFKSVNVLGFLVTSFGDKFSVIKSNTIFGNVIRYATQEEIELLEGKNELEVGRWYKRNTDEIGTLLHLDAVCEFYLSGFGFCEDMWVGKEIEESYNGWTTEGWILATEEEVKSALVAEAKRRGYVLGCKVKDLDDCNVITFTKGGSYVISTRSNKLFAFRCTIFNNGKWAEIIPPHLKNPIHAP